MKIKIYYNITHHPSPITYHISHITYQIIKQIMHSYGRIFQTSQIQISQIQISQMALGR